MYEQEAYCNMLVKYREELARPIDEAMEFLKRVEAQLDSISGAGTGARLSLAGKASRRLISLLVHGRTASWRIFYCHIYAPSLPHWEMVVLDSGSGCSGSCHSELAWLVNLIIDID